MLFFLLFNSFWQCLTIVDIFVNFGPFFSILIFFETLITILTIHGNLCDLTMKANLAMFPSDHRMCRGSTDAPPRLDEDQVPVARQRCPGRPRPLQGGNTAVFCQCKPLKLFQVGDCMVKMYRQEGLRSFWKGIVPPVMVETPKRGWKVLRATT